MTSATKGVPARGPGRPRRPDGLDPHSAEAREARGRARVNLELSSASLALLDCLAFKWGVSRSVVVTLLVEAATARDK